jgi:glycerol uptake facilitator-like aquaporin
VKEDIPLRQQRPQFRSFGLVLVIALASRFRMETIPMAVAAFITSACWFTSSTSFANPAVTFARAMTDTFAGISPRSVPLFVCGQLIGGAMATLLARWLLAGSPIHHDSK